jgi:FixJ family two-component response regulator
MGYWLQIYRAESMKDQQVSQQPSLNEPLTRREKKVLALLAQDLSYREIAAAETLAFHFWRVIFIISTVGSADIMAKCDVTPGYFS